jgi:NADH-quinone oxidoreductase subunit C
VTDSSGNTGSGEREQADTTAGSTSGLPTSPSDLSHDVVSTREGMFGVRGSGDTSGYGGLTPAVVMPGGSEPPYGGWLDVLCVVLGKCL